MRARAYAGKIAAVITMTLIPLTTPYAKWLLWNHHAGAIRYG
jgi:hypothetical protein